jgi:DNA polymerase
MNIITIDTETYYDKEYSLSKMQTDAYVLDPRFEVIGVCVIDPSRGGEPEWFSGTEEETHDWLHQFDWANSAIRAHNTLFDGFILTQKFGIRPKLWMDTLAQARMLYPWLPSHSLASVAEHLGLGKKGNEVVAALGVNRELFTPFGLLQYANYCKNDTVLCKKMGEIMDEFSPALHMKLIDMTVRMFTEPMLVGDEQRMQELYDAEVKRKEELLAQATTDRSIIMSNDKFADALRALGVSPPTKISATTNKEAYAFAKSDKQFTDLLEHPEIEVQALVAARLGTKTTIAETRAQRFIDMSKRGPLPVYLNFWGAKTTGRYSGGNMCLSGCSWVTVLRAGEVLDILMSALRSDDLVWDGRGFVAHDGLVCKGFAEVIEYDGVVGTRDHKVFVVGREEPVELGVAASEGLVLQVGGVPDRVARAA